MASVAVAGVQVVLRNMVMKVQAVVCMTAVAAFSCLVYSGD